MPDQVLQTLAPTPGSLQIDATVGGGGHTERILEAANPDGRVLGIDADAIAIDRVAIRLARYGDRLVLRRANFRELADVAPAAGFGSVDGALFDLGLSSYQLADRDRGFGSGRRPARHALRRHRGVPASELSRPSTLTAGRPVPPPRRGAVGLEDREGDRRRAADRADRDRRGPGRPIERISPPNPASAGAPTATRVFQALRIAVNEEPRRPVRGLPRPSTCCGRAGLVVLSYHSLEDRIVKRFLASERRGCVCPPKAPVCVAASRRACGSVTRPSMTRPPKRSTPAREPGARARSRERLAA
jgi:16S rRNA (cytosine1402-N4)-methyltransferase